VTLRLVGLSHRVAPVELRERVALSVGRAAELARALAGEAGEAVCLSTCNRTELYVVGADAEERAVGALAGIAALGEDELRGVAYRLDDEASALHLFRVAAGLDSMVPGEGEILGQVRAAYEAGAAGPLLDRLFRQALHAGKRVRSQTAIGESPASVPSAAAALAAQLFGDLAGCSVLLVGAGKIADLAARAVAARGARVAFVANRSAEKAAEVARRFGGEAIPFHGLADALAGVDVVVSSTSAPGYILERETVARALAARKGRPLFLIDIAVPRDLDPSIHELDGCYLYDIDDLEAVVAETLTLRRTEAERAEHLVAEEADRFRTWRASLDVVPAIASLRARAEEIRTSELAKVDRRMSDDALRTLESVTAQILNKLLHLPTVRMKEAAVTADGTEYADAVRYLFGLEEETP